MHRLYFKPPIYLCYFLLFIVAVLSFISCDQDAGEEHSVSIGNNLTIPQLLERKSAIGPEAERMQIKKTYDDALTALKAKPGAAKQYLTLASVFITEGRVTRNAGYYDKAALEMLDKVFELNPKDKNLIFEALSLKSTIYLNMHQFEAALEVARQGQQLNAYNAGIYGALVDANVELGHYDEAVKYCDKMLSIRPDLRSYSRASYLRQIYGDNPGAIAAMKMAVAAGVPGVESTEWSRVTLGDLYLNAGKPDTAELVYQASLFYRPGYPFAEMGLAKVASARKNYKDAIALARNAIKILSEGAFVSFLGEQYELQGDTAKAKTIFMEVIHLLENGEKEQARDKNAGIGHNVNRELALAYINNGDLDQALSRAQNDYRMRPDNLDANYLMAWIYYRQGDFKNAKKHADKLFATHLKNANMLYTAGLIYNATGDRSKGTHLIKEALTVSPFIDGMILKHALH